MIQHDDIQFASLTDVGVKRSHNQDSHALLPASDADQYRQRGHVFLVADGMGAHAVGELASKMAADSIPHIYSKHALEGTVGALRRAFIEANQTIHNRGQANKEFQGMGTTGTALVIRPEGAWVGHVGDSRAYRVRGGMIEQLSFDHSLLWELAKRQRRSPDELSGVPSNVIIRSLGPEANVQVDVEGPHPLLPGDAYVLCSDGLSGPVNDREIGAISAALPPEEASRFLIHMANLQGGPDNITAVVVKIKGDPPANLADAAANPWSPAPVLRRGIAFARRIWAFAALVLGIALAIVAIFLTAYEQAGDVAVFILAGLFLAAGLIGLVVQILFDKQGAGEESERRKLHLYRQIPCPVDQELVERLMIAIESLQQRLQENQWAFDEAGFGELLQLAKDEQAKQNWLESFRIACRAMLMLMEVVSQHRNKEEAFRPLFDPMAG